MPPTPWPHSYFPFPTELATAIRGRGAIPMLDWSSMDLSAGGSLDQPKFTLASITAGKHDAFIRQWAADATCMTSSPPPEPAMSPGSGRPILPARMTRPWQ